jgi:hypothetical protein
MRFDLGVTSWDTLDDSITFPASQLRRIGCPGSIFSPAARLESFVERVQQELHDLRFGPLETVFIHVREEDKDVAGSFVHVDRSD